MIDPNYSVQLARDDRGRAAAQRLRYEVFVAELGGDGPLVDHRLRQEIDEFDGISDHLLLCDERRPADERVVGVYRLLRRDQAEFAGGFYTQSEYDLTPLLANGRRLLELGRSCLHRDYRGSTAMMHLWQGLADYVARHRIELLFGVASFHGTDFGRFADSLSLLRHRHLAPPDLRVRSRQPAPIPWRALEEIDRAAAMCAVPALIKAYIRLGGFVGDGAFVDHQFNTTDICMLLDTSRLNASRATLYTHRQT